MAKKAEQDEKSPLRILRERSNLTLTELGRQVGVSDRNVWDWERGLVIPRLDRAVALAKALDISLPELCQALGIKDALTNADANLSVAPLKLLRDELGMSQEEFARQIGTSARTISRWESGDNVPTFTIAQMKALDRLLRSRGKTLTDLPDQFGPLPDAES